MLQIDQERDNCIQLIEGRTLISGRFSSIQRIDPRAGSGNFSLVFGAHDNDTNREVALKFFYPPRTRDSLYRQLCFHREAEILRTISGQPDILQLVHPCDQLTMQLSEASTGLTMSLSLTFFATELADSTIFEYIYADEVTPLRSLRLFRVMCRGVQRLHAHRICHRDIKPENFFTFKREEVHIGDFGTARIMDANIPPLLPDYRGWRGDRRYTAPEQCVVINEKPDLFYIGDMYSLGAILFEIFTKQPLFTHVFDYSFHDDLASHFVLVQPETRELLLGEILPDIVRARRLPDIDDFDTEIPSYIKVRLNRLYKSLACLDYRNRIKDFAEVFHQINLCTQILEKESAYRKWLELRRKVEDERKARRAAGQQTHKGLKKL